MNIGKIILKDIKKLLPLNRSITGKGTKKTLIYLKDILKQVKNKQKAKNFAAQVTNLTTLIASRLWSSVSVR